MSSESYPYFCMDFSLPLQSSGKRLSTEQILIQSVAACRHFSHKLFRHTSWRRRWISDTGEDFPLLKYRVETLRTVTRIIIRKRRSTKRSTKVSKNTYREYHNWSQEVIIESNIPMSSYNSSRSAIHSVQQIITIIN